MIRPQQTADEAVRELTENYDRLMRDLKNVVSQLTRLAAMKDGIEEAGGQLPPHVAAGLRKVDARFRDGRSGDALANSKRTAAAPKRRPKAPGVVAKTSS